MIKKMKRTQEEMIQIVPVQISKLKKWKNNPREKSEADLKKLAGLLKAHGFNSPLVVDESSMVIYKGNGTFEAAKIAGFKSIPVVFRKFKSKAAAEAYGIADNKASEWSGWDEEMLQKIMEAEEFESLQKETGFSETELSGISEGWETDFDSVENIEENEDGILSTIKIRCRQEDMDDIKEEIESVLEDYEYELS